MMVQLQLQATLHNILDGAVRHRAGVLPGAIDFYLLAPLRQQSSTAYSKASARLGSLLVLALACGRLQQHTLS